MVYEGVELATCLMVVPLKIGSVPLFVVLSVPRFRLSIRPESMLFEEVKRTETTT